MYNMDLYLLETILLLLVAHSHCYDLNNLKQCCDKNVTFHSVSKTCDNGKAISLKCPLSDTLIFLDRQYVITEDSSGVYVDTFQSDTIIREPNFCVGAWNWSEQYPNIKVIMVCGSKYWTKRPKDSSFYDIVHLAMVFLNFGSSVALLLTAFIYYYLHSLQDVHSSCAFHFTLNSGLWHGTLAYRLLFQFEFMNSKPTLCISKVSLWGYVGLAFFCWSAILSLDTWNQSKGNHFTDENVLRQRYKVFGYGIPAILILVSNIHFYLGHYDERRLELNCYRHQNIMLWFYMVLPISLILISNCFFFVQSQRNFVKAYTSQPKSALRTLRYRLFINARLIFIMGLPWILGVLLAFLKYPVSRDSWLAILLLFNWFLISSEGISIFLILVAFRKRILREIAISNLFSCVKVPERWKTLQDSETVEESENEARNNSENAENFVERSFNSLAREAQISLA